MERNVVKVSREHPLATAGYGDAKKSKYEQRNATREHSNRIWRAADFGKPRASKVRKVVWGRTPRQPTSKGSKCTVKPFCSQVAASSEYFDFFSVVR